MAMYQCFALGDPHVGTNFIPTIPAKGLSCLRISLHVVNVQGVSDESCLHAARFSRVSGNFRTPPLT